MKNRNQKITKMLSLSAGAVLLAGSVFTVSQPIFNLRLGTSMSFSRSKTRKKHWFVAVLNSI